MISVRIETARTGARWLLATLYSAAGLVHLGYPHVFLSIMPHWVPLPHATIVATGLCEVIGAIGLLTARWRRAAAAALALYAICVYPANIQHALNDLADANSGQRWFYHGPRLLFQPVIIWWTLFSGQITDWPFSSPDATKPNRTHRTERQGRTDMSQ